MNLTRQQAQRLVDDIAADEAGGSRTALARIYGPCPWCGMSVRFRRVRYINYPRHRPVLVEMCRREHDVSSLWRRRREKGGDTD